MIAYEHKTPEEINKEKKEIAWLKIVRKAMLRRMFSYATFATIGAGSTLASYFNNETSEILSFTGAVKVGLTILFANMAKSLYEEQKDYKIYIKNAKDKHSIKVKEISFYSTNMKQVNGTRISAYNHQKTSKCTKLITLKNNS